MSALRLLSVNARTVDGGTGGLVRLMSDSAAHVVAVHGAPDLVRWRQAVAALARRSGLVVVGGGGRRAGSALLLSSLGVDAGATRDVRYTGASGLHPAGGTLALLRWHGQEFALGATTLVGNSAVRRAQVGELDAALEALTPSAPPSVISAEGTDRPGTATWQALLNNRVSAAHRVFVDTRIGVEQARTLDGHPFTSPAIVELVLG